MTGGKPKGNIAITALVALLALYVGSYGVIRFNSTPGGKGVTLLGISKSDKAAIKADFLSPRSQKLLGRVEPLRKFYKPLRWVDNQLTGAGI